jgi:TRAP-type C4-dicarboxylate transport system permease small subunit
MAPTDDSEYPTGGPRTVATVFKVAALLALVGGIVAAMSTAADLSNHSSLSTSGVLGISIGILAGAILLAATLGFFAYMLELVLDIRESCEILADAAPEPE